MNTKLEELRAKLIKTRSDFDATVERIRNNKDLNVEGEARLIEQAYRKAHNDHANLVDQYRAAEEEIRSSLEKRAFKAPSQGDSSSYREALRTAEGARDLEALLKRAQLTSDQILIRAIGTTLFTQGGLNALRIVASFDPDVRALIEFEVGYGKLRDKSKVFVDKIYTSAVVRPSQLSHTITNELMDEN